MLPVDRNVGTLSCQNGFSKIAQRHLICTNTTSDTSTMPPQAGSFGSVKAQKVTAHMFVGLIYQLFTNVNLYFHVSKYLLYCPHIWNLLPTCVHLFVLSLTHFSNMPYLRRDKEVTFVTKGQWIMLTADCKSQSCHFTRISSKQPRYILWGGKGTMPLESEDTIPLSVMCHALPVNSLFPLRHISGNSTTT